MKGEINMKKTVEQRTKDLAGKIITTIKDAGYEVKTKTLDYECGECLIKVEGITFLIETFVTDEKSDSIIAELNKETTTILAVGEGYEPGNKETTEEVRVALANIIKTTKEELDILKKEMASAVEGYTEAIEETFAFLGDNLEEEDKDEVTEVVEKGNIKDIAITMYTKLKKIVMDAGTSARDRVKAMELQKKFVDALKAAQESKRLAAVVDFMKKAWKKIVAVVKGTGAFSLRFTKIVGRGIAAMAKETKVAFKEEVIERVKNA